MGTTNRPWSILLMIEVVDCVDSVTAFLPRHYHKINAIPCLEYFAFSFSFSILQLIG